MDVTVSVTYFSNGTAQISASGESASGLVTPMFTDPDTPSQACGYALVE
ncbi:MAG TPA: hypothetical protein VKU01_20775 [Bryobacteraceae bacterium]|nr:hypothetical protein [Bryobacteraceae bacterium]